jgi:hypothetical protein
MFDFGLLFIPERRAETSLETDEVRRRRTAGQVVIQLPTLQRFAVGERQETGRGHDGCQREESQRPYR